ncbi:hypothetical protein [Amycolatopsis pithecellobii]|uniref:Uncharacterized protein n=1 Tax=Amycolatopsis pithecellobii TaxID=664692 RepID=A0A6N7Z9J0_9PSEU|nr:hypothetical protein [Amycolatopsis pithecellobii]MTD58408.1 hypothetical protein [Amycolatopsis pithecellobii]
MARHRLDDNDNNEKWGGPELAENQDHQPHQHRRDRNSGKSEVTEPEADRTQPPPR